VLYVNTTADNTTNGDGFCSLREAVAAANADADFNECTYAGTYGEESIRFSISGNPTITLSGSSLGVADDLYINGYNNGNYVVIDGGDALRAFSNSASLQLAYLTIQNTSSSGGSAIYNSDTLEIDFSSFINNQTSGNGGAIYNVGGVITITNSTFSGNTASAGYGGAIANYEGILELNNVTIANNTALQGGGVSSWSGSATVPILNVSNTIVANNSPEDCTALGSALGGSNNIIETTHVTFSCAALITSSIDPALEPLTGNPPHFPITTGSSAIDTGDNNTCETYDVRGWPRQSDGDLDGSFACDTGAFEFHARIFVDKDGSDANGFTWAGAWTKLQDGLGAASKGSEVWVADGVYYPDEGYFVTADNQSMTFNLKDTVAVYGGFNGTETSLNQRDIKTNVTVLSGDIDQNDTNADTNYIAETPSDIQGNNAYHVVTGDDVINAILSGFTITAGNAAGSGIDNSGGGMLNTNGAEPVLSYLTFIGNNAAYGGGGMVNVLGARPEIYNSVFNANTAAYGGGIFNNNADYTAIDATLFMNNSATFGGGIENVNGSDFVSLTNLTFYNNTATTGFGGGLYNDASFIELINTTISNNTANAGVGNGGGFYNKDASPTMINTIIANNSSGDDCIHFGTGSAATAATNNLIKNGTYACGITNGSAGNIVGKDPVLGNLGNYGGFTSTMPILNGSPALNAGTNTNCPAEDQRGVSRPFSTACDIGAYESQYATFISAASQDGWILEKSETASAGGSLNATLSTITLGDDASDKQYRGILSFNTAGLDDAATVLFAAVKVKKSSIVGTNPFNTHGSLLCDMKLGSFGTSALALGDFKASATMSSAGNFASIGSSWYRANLLTGVSAFINKTGLTQCRIRFTKDDNDDRGADQLLIHSGSAGNSNNRPMLIVEYYLP
jgi:CSLREA domain-containing protein